MLKKWIPVVLIVLVAGGVAAYVITGDQGDEKKQGQKTAKQGKQSGRSKADRRKIETGDVNLDATYEEKYEVNANVSGGDVTASDSPDEPTKSVRVDSPDEPNQPQQVQQSDQPQVQQPETPQQPQVQTPSGPN